MRFHYAEGLSSQIYRFFANIRPVRLRNRIAAAGRGGVRCAVRHSGVPCYLVNLLLCNILLRFEDGTGRSDPIGTFY